MPLIETIGLTKTYGGAPVLKKLDLTIERGEFVALLGANGSGKSTLLRLLCGLSKPTAGRIIIGGWQLPREAHAVRAQIGVVSHKPLLYENLTALENLRFFATLYHLPADERRLADALQRVGLGKRGGDLIRTFSRGMQQRLSIARATLHNPDVLFLDEPYTGLDQDGAAALDDLLTQSRREGRTLIMATHELVRAAALASRAILLVRGGVGQDSPTDGMSADDLALAYQRVTGVPAVGA